MEGRSDAELVAFSERLLHDIQAFFRVGRSLTRAAVGFGRPLRWEVETALVESLALHTRALSDFFYSRRRGTHRHQRDDAFAFDFFEPRRERWFTIAGEPGPWVRSVRMYGEPGTTAIDRFGSQIGHLNYRVVPVSDYARGWPVMQLAHELGAVVCAFADAVPDAKVSTDFKARTRGETPLTARLPTQRLPIALWTTPATPRRLVT